MRVNEEMPSQITNEELEKFPEVMRPVVQRWGKDMFLFAGQVAGTNSAIDYMLASAERFHKLRTPALVIMNNFGSLIDEVIRARGWEMNHFLECIGDIGRAEQLAQVAERKIVLH